MRHDQRRAWVEVDLGALKRNASLLAHRARVPLLPMVKADAYGLGVEAVTWALERVDPWGYGVASVAEGAHLRSLGVTRLALVRRRTVASRRRHRDESGGDAVGPRR
jgi:alanine racemase